MSTELSRVAKRIVQTLEASTMASLNCIACVILSSSPTQRSALVWNSRAVGAGVKNAGSFAGIVFSSRELPSAILKGLEQHGGSGISSECSISTSSSGDLSARWRGRGVWLGNEQLGKNSNSLTPREKFVFRADVSRRSFLFQLGDDDGYEEGPIELPPRELEIDPLAFPDASPLQIVASFVLTGTIALLLVRTLRRRAQRAKEMKFRSTGATKESIKEDARKAAIAKLTQAPEVPVAAPSPVQTFLGAVVAGAIALLLYRVTMTVEGSFVGKPVSMNYSIRNLTITVRTIINGILYLATFVFAANSLGLGLYSIQLLFDGSSSTEPPRAEPLEEQESSSETEKSSEAED